VIAGVGLRRGCPADEIVALVRRACAETGRAASALAAPSFKQGEAGLGVAAAQLGVTLLLVEDDALAAAQARCVTQSETARREVGVGSVAEGSALAAAGAGSQLLLPRIAGARATCALAEAPS
jgi:cobalt-precorrin 5A hydrolase